ncbi:MAG: hypothetical protein CBB71_21930 [Rhodopirellula sp. TMED11]|nr:MAG: hypothetical protein CBB71_21930 [Rhodopirellula sp. TMED11]
MWFIRWRNPGPFPTHRKAIEASALCLPSKASDLRCINFSGEAASPLPNSGPTARQTRKAQKVGRRAERSDPIIAHRPAVHFNEAQTLDFRRRFAGFLAARVPGVVRGTPKKQLESPHNPQD